MFSKLSPSSRARQPAVSSLSCFVGLNTLYCQTGMTVTFLETTPFQNTFSPWPCSNRAVSTQAVLFVQPIIITFPQTLNAKKKKSERKERENADRPCHKSHENFMAACPHVHCHQHWLCRSRSRRDFNKFKYS